MPHFLASGSRGRKLTAASLSAAAAALFLVAGGNGQAQAASPTCALYNYYAQGASGTGNYGTADQIWTWSHWNVDDPSSGNFSDESVWSINYNNQSNALEVGFFTGWGNDNINGDPNWTNGMVPYYTLDNGAEEYDEWGTYLPTDTYIWMYAQATNYASYAYVNGQLNTSIGYVVGQPRWGYTQGETSDTGSWMGGGSGDSSTLYWIDGSGNFHDWTYMNVCADYPYWASTSNGTDWFSNGGY